MVHFPGLARARLWIQRAVPRFYRRGFPHSDIPGSKPACGSPRLIAAGHVLLRLLAPRHPPYALSSLTTKLTQPLSDSRPRNRASLPLLSQRERRSGALNYLSRSRRAGWDRCEFAPCYVPVSVVKELCPLTLSPEASGPKSQRACPPRAGNKKPGAKRRAVCRYSMRGTARCLEPNSGCVRPRYRPNRLLLQQPTYTTSALAPWQVLFCTPDGPPAGSTSAASLKAPTHGPSLPPRLPLPVTGVGVLSASRARLSTLLRWLAARSP